MYQGNGTTKSFPLPAEADGSSVYLLGPNGVSVRAKSGEAYVVEGGAAVFSVAPPAGWSVLFEEPVNVGKMRSVCTVVYPDGTWKEMTQDPWELLLEVKGILDEAKKNLSDARNERVVISGTFKAKAEESEKVLDGRLLNYSAKAEDAIAAAVKASADDVATIVNRNMLELRKKHKEVREIRDVIEEARLEAVSAASTAASDAEVRMKEDMADLLEKNSKIHESMRLMLSEVREIRDDAKNAAFEAGRNVTESFERRADMLLQELKSVKGSLDHEIKALIERHIKDCASEHEAIVKARDEARQASLQANEILRNVRATEERNMRSERNIQTFAEKVTKFQIIFEARIAEYRAALSQQGGGLK